MQANRGANSSKCGTHDEPSVATQVPKKQRALSRTASEVLRAHPLPIERVCCHPTYLAPDYTLRYMLGSTGVKQEEG